MYAIDFLNRGGDQVDWENQPAIIEDTFKKHVLSGIMPHQDYWYIRKKYFFLNLFCFWYVRRWCVANMGPMSSNGLFVQIGTGFKWLDFNRCPNRSFRKITGNMLKNGTEQKKIINFYGPVSSPVEIRVLFKM